MPKKVKVVTSKCSFFILPAGVNKELESLGHKLTTFYYCELERDNPDLVRMVESLVLKDLAGDDLAFAQDLTVSEIELEENEIFIITRDKAAGPEKIHVVTRFEEPAISLKIVLSEHGESFKLSERAIQALERLEYKGEIDEDIIPRDNPLLVSVVEALGYEATEPPGHVRVDTIDVSTITNEYWVFYSSKFQSRCEFASGDPSEFYMSKGVLSAHKRTYFEPVQVVAESEHKKDDNAEDEENHAYLPGCVMV